MSKFLICPKCLRGTRREVRVSVLRCKACDYAWDPPHPSFHDAYYCDTRTLSPSLVAERGKRFTFSSFPATLGRDSEFEELHQNLAVSRQHFWIDASREGYVVCDLGGPGGSCLNGTRLAPQVPHPLQPNDLLSISGVNLRFEAHFSPPASDKVEGRPAIESITLDGDKHLLTVGGGESKANIVIKHPTLTGIVACFHRPSHDGPWQVLVIQHGLLQVNGEPVLDREIGPEDEIQIGGLQYYLASDGNSLVPRVAANALSIATSKLRFDINTSAGAKAIICDANVELPAGRLTAIIGASGSGKSTLVRILAGALSATGGELRLSGEKLSPSQYMDKIKGRVAYVPQDDIIHAELTVQDTLDFAASIRISEPCSAEEKKARVENLLQELELSPHRDKLIGTLSGGQRKRVNVAVELLSRPGVLFLDEPTTGLDFGAEQKMLKSLRQLARQGRTVAFVTHSLQAIEEVDYVVFLSDHGDGGRVVVQGYTNLLKETHDFRDMGDWASLFAKHKEPAKRGRIAAQKASRTLAKFALGSSSIFAPLLRYTSLWLSTPRTSSFVLLFLPLLLGCLIRIATPLDGAVGSDGLLFGVICSFWLGMNQSVREIVKERVLMQRERFAGVGSLSYIGSKVAFFGILGCFQSVLLMAPLLWLRASGGTFGLGPAELHCPALLLWLDLWAGLLAGTCLGLLLSAVCLFARSKGEILAVLLVILVTLPQILFSPKVLGELADTAADYHSFHSPDSTRQFGEIASYLTTSRYLFLPLDALQKSKGDYPDIWLFNGTLVVMSALCCIVMTFIALEIFSYSQRSKSRW